jgi:predicted rRNA methylase YqxC with S4 and FtsJ domains
MKSSTDQGEIAAQPPSNAPQLTPWLVRISEVLENVADEVLRRFGAQSVTKLGNEYYLIKTATPEAVRHSEVAKFARWNLPIQHSWPCNPQKMDGFVEKAAQTLVKKFGPRNPQAILIGQLNPGSPDKYYKSLASNLRGRTLQLFPAMKVTEVEEQDGNAETLFCLVGKEGLFCGMQSPKESNGLYAGGSKYISNDSPDTISRAGAKIAEALHYLRMYRPALAPGMHWVELGASPGGMTSELLTRGFKVTAIDRAALDKRLDGHPNLTFVRNDVAQFHPKPGTAFDAILSDMNGEPEESMEQVIRLSKHLKKSGIVVFTLKVPRVETVQRPLDIFKSIIEEAAKAGLTLFAQTHLTYNRHEFTLFFDANSRSSEIGSRWWKDA